MAAQLTAERTPLRVRILFGALAALAVLAGFAGWRAMHAGPEVVRGTVAVVNADATKICITPAGGGEQWCGGLATAGGQPPAPGQSVTVLVNTVDTAPDGTLTIGTVVPSEFTLR